MIFWRLSAGTVLAASAFSFSQDALSAELPFCEAAWKTKGIPAEQSQFKKSRDKSYDNFSQKLDRQQCQKPWTILVYMAADNNLNAYALLDLYEMESKNPARSMDVGSTSRLDLIVQLDTPESRNFRRIHIFENDEAYDPSKGAEDFKRRGELDVSSPTVFMAPEEASKKARRDLDDFLSWGVQHYPSKHLMVIVWGHGQGWTTRSSSVLSSGRYLNPEDVSLGVVPPKSAIAEKGVFSERKFGGLAFDQSDNSLLSVPDLAAVLGRLSRKQRSGAAIDVYASDACLMQMVEVASQVAPNTRFVVGSAQIQDFLGMPYRDILSYMNHAANFPAESDEAFEVAKKLPELSEISMSATGRQGSHSRQGSETLTISSISTAELQGSLLPALQSLAQSLVEYLDEDSLRAIDLQFIMQSAPSFQGGAQDLGAFFVLLGNLLSREHRELGFLTLAAERLDQAVQDARLALLRTVVGQSLGTRYSGGLGEKFYLLGMRAVSAWLPTSPEDYKLRISDFNGSRFYGRLVPSWKSWISKVYSD